MLVALGVAGLMAATSIVASTVDGDVLVVKVDGASDLTWRRGRW